MIASAMLFLVAVSALAAAGALLGETGLRRMGAPTRLAWLAAMAFGPALLGVAGLRRLAPQAPVATPAWAPVIEMPALTLGAAPTEGGPGVEGVALLVWLAAGLAFLALVARTHRTLLRERSGWESTQVLGRHVFVSTDRGPAVAGMREPWIVVPRWVLALPEAELRMVLLHEEEHLRARDTWLLGAALALVALTAWNPVTWWQLRRLRAAMEVDCDRRVLRAVPDRATYGASLLTVAARAAGPSLGLAAFTERSLNLKRRILAMTEKTSRWTAMGGGVLVVLGLVVGVQACGVESPVGLTPPSGARAVEAPVAPAPRPEGNEVLPGGGVVFTPFTRAPRPLNLAEIRSAVEENYPPLLKDAGVMGVAQVWMFIDTQGVVTDLRLNRTSGHQPLDDAALRVAGRFRFEPALNGEEPVGVWVSFPIAFGDPRQPSTVVVAPGGDDPEPPPPSRTAEELAAEPVFTPFTVAPSILNRVDIIRAMEEAYTPEMREARLVGTVRVYFFIDAEGRVARTLIDDSSGVPELDEAALRIAQVYEFSPALNKDTKVPVWVSFPISFRVP
ncbi:MAG: hypothetical protein AMXMBFR53_03220 [Gemmatimonadota bacterium]